MISEQQNLNEEKRRLIHSIEAIRGQARKQHASDALDALRDLETRVLQACRRLDVDRAAGEGPSGVDESQEAGERTSSGAGKYGDQEQDGFARDEEVKRLREELKTARRTCALLEEELEHLEAKALAAIGEAGALRRRMDEERMARTERGGGYPGLIGAPEARRLQEQVRRAEEERGLLVGALADSEREVGRLTKALGLAVRKLRVA